MNVTIRVSQDLHRAVLADLRRPHSFAAERVVFCSCVIGNRGAERTLVLLTDFWSVPDDQYLNDPGSGARINSVAIRTAMQRVLTSKQGVLHVHLHEHDGEPDFSLMDRTEQPRLVQSFRHTDAKRPHGMLVLSNDSAVADIWLPGESALRPADQISLVGWPTVILKKYIQDRPVKRFSRQSFLGPLAQTVIESARVGIIGLGGGGSHIAQQLAHLGFLDFVLLDPDCIDESNLNRLVGGTEWDVRAGTPKVFIVERAIHAVRNTASVTALPRRWQDALNEVRSCDLILAGIDGFEERRQIEATCRRYLIPYIDIGMDVHVVGSEPPRVAGQLIASIPGLPCMQCLGFLNERSLTREAQRYGDAGEQPQVVWSNGVLASSAVGLAVDILTNWSKRNPAATYLSYDGNLGTLQPHARLPFVRSRSCCHYPLTAVGDLNL